MSQIINDFIMKNLIYCEDTHSLIHRIYDLWKKDGLPKNKNEAQTDAWNIIMEMNLEGHCNEKHT